MKAKELDCEKCNKELKNIHHLALKTLPRNTVELKKKQTKNEQNSKKSK